MEEKQRHGCVTAWLIFIIVVNSMVALLYLLGGDLVVENFPNDVSTPMIALLGVMSIGNVVFSVMLLRWQKVGFWGFALTSIIALAINLHIGIGMGQSITGLIGLGLLYAVLQIRSGDKSAWESLE